MTDTTRDLIQRLAKELDLCRQMVLDDRTSTHPLADEARAVLARWGRAAIKPVPVSERPWEREGWCDNNGWCWGFDADDTDPFWSFDRPDAWVCWTHVLPHYALPIPPSTETP